MVPFFIIEGSDSNNNTVCLGVAFMYENEYEESWHTFLRFIKDTYPFIDKIDSVFISDGEKGLKKAFSSVFCDALQFYFQRHMTDSRKKLSKDDKQLYNEACSKANPDLVNCIFNRISAKQKKKWADAGIATTQMFPGLCHHTYGR